MKKQSNRCSHMTGLLNHQRRSSKPGYVLIHLSALRLDESQTCGLQVVLEHPNRLCFPERPPSLLATSKISLATVVPTANTRRGPPRFRGHPGAGS